jgi:hypothetical protein
MLTGAGMLRRVMAGLLALALLVVSGVPGPLRAMPTDHHARYAVQDCVQPDGADGHAAAAPSEREQPPTDDRHGATPGLACCIASQCPMLVGLAPPPTAALPSPTPSVAVAIAARRVAGIELAPALPPPRVAV